MSATPQAATPGSRAAPMPAQCGQWGCRPQQTEQLTDGYAVTLWLSPNQQDYRSRPVVQLLDHAVAVQWWISPQGDSWNGSVTCDTKSAHPNCALLDTTGMHAGVAEILLLQEGHLVHPQGAEATADSGAMRAADLDGDGYLDVIGSTNDYKPNYAQGHNFWQTFRYAAGRLVATGCAPEPTGSAAPTHLLTGACPKI